MRVLVCFALSIVLLGTLAACGYTGDIDPMERQPKMKPWRENKLFDDERAMRPLPEGVVPRERDLSDPPTEVTADMLALGKKKFDQVCATCHGFVGDGQSEVAKKMALRKPPSLHDQRRRALPADKIYQVVTEGWGLMPRYANQLDKKERWAVVAYVRALQLSQNVPAAELPEDLKKQLEATP
jgi:mono/diheme cytochrome c family protein